MEESKTTKWCLRHQPNKDDVPTIFSVCGVGWLWALAFFCTFSAHAAQPLNLVENSASYPLGLHLSYLEDKEGRLTLQDILANKDSAAWVRSEKAVPSFGFTASTYWFALDIHNQNAANAEWLLQSLYPPLDHITAHVIYPNQAAMTYHGGDAVAFSQRAVKHRNTMFSVPLAPGQTVRIYLAVKTESSLQLPLVLLSPKALMVKDHEEQYALGLFYGSLITLLIFNLLVFASIRDMSYLYSVWYLLAWILFQMALNGLAYEYLWPEQTAWANKAVPFFIGFALLGMVQFTRSLLLTDQHLPAMDRLLVYAAAGSAVIMAWALWGSYALAIQLGTAGAMVIALLVVTTGVLSLRRGVLQARFFMLAWSCLLVGIVLYVLKTFGFIKSTPFTEYAMQIGSAFEGILLSFALAHRMRLLKDENERVLAQGTATLERRVQERTTQLDQALLSLSDANGRLMQLSHIDGLTGVNNRAYFDEQIAFEWHRSLKARSPVGLLLVDVDHFKRFNDTHGHQGGDACLRLVAKTIQQQLSNPANRCYRYGGEEFVVLLPNTDRAQSSAIAEQLRAAIEGLSFQDEGIAATVTISVGVNAVIPSESTSSASLIHGADQALYQAKREGRNRVCVVAQ
jgi:diguanylate cyclase (GGDEF)-like protein